LPISNTFIPERSLPLAQTQVARSKTRWSLLAKSLDRLYAERANPIISKTRLSGTARHPQKRAFTAMTCGNIAHGVFAIQCKEENIMIYAKFILLSLIFIFISFSETYGETVTVYALEAMPYCGIVDGEHQGIAIDILNEATTYGAPKFIFRFDIPWKRAQEMIQDQSKDISAIIPFSYSEQRKNQFKWISLLCTRHFKIYSLSENIQTLDDAKEHSIGIVRGHVLINIMKDLGFKKIYSGAENAKKNIKMLHIGRVDGIADSDLIVIYNWNQINEDDSIIYEGPEIGDANYIYIASSLDFPQDVADKIDRALEIMRDSGRIDAIIQKWIDK